MLTLAHLIHTRARLVLALTGLFVAVAAGVGVQVVGSLTNGGYSDPASPSVVAAADLARAAGVAPQPGVIVLVHTRAPVESQPARAVVARVVAAVRAQPQIGRVASALDRGQHALVARDRHHTYVMGFFRAATSEPAASAAVQRVEQGVAAIPGTTVGGGQLASDQLQHELSTQLPLIELAAFSILLVLSLVAFRSLVAALLPLLVGGIAVAGSLLIMRGLAQVTSLSVFSLNLVTGLGLGLAIDYSLFIVYRYREELARCGHCRDALERTLETAGRTVAFSSLTVTLALLSLLVFPQTVLSSMGIAAAVVTAFAAFAALVPLSALLTLLGPRVNALAPRRLQRARERSDRASTDGAWYRTAMAVMRRPGRVAAASAAVLLAIGIPALHVDLGSTDSHALPASASARQVDDALTGDFTLHASTPVTVVVRAPGSATPALDTYARRLAQLPGAAVAAAPRRIAAALWRIDLLTRTPALAPASQRLIGAIQAMPSPYPALATGRAASQYDEHASLRFHLLLALAILAGTTIVVLFTMTGSIVLPIKSLIMNLLTLSGAFGLLVLIFQQRRLKDCSPTRAPARSSRRT